MSTRIVILGAGPGGYVAAVRAARNGAQVTVVEKQRVGGGVIGCEFACILSALGSRVTIVEALDRLLPLPAMDESCFKILMREMKKRKIQFMVNRTVTAVDKTASGLSVTIGPSPVTDNLNARDKQALHG